MRVNHSGQFERVGKTYRTASEACDAVMVDPSRLPRGNGRADVSGVHGKGDASIRRHADGHGGCVCSTTKPDSVPYGVMTPGRG